MGSYCCRAAVTWADDDDGEPAEYEISPTSGGYEKTSLRGNSRSSTAKGNPPAVAKRTEVKIRLTKKQLEKLLHQVDVQGLPVHEVLARLLDAASTGGGDVDGVYDRSHAGSWRPVLWSIPESPE